MGTYLIIGGIVFLLYALGMKTTVWTELGSVHNIGLLNERQNYVIISSLMILIGVILNITALNKAKKITRIPSDNATEDFEAKKCIFCGEIIKSVAKVCRYCGKDQPSENIEAIMDIDPEPAPSNNYAVKIEVLDDPKKIYLIAKEFYKDVGVSFVKAKEFLSTGTTVNFQDKSEALKFIEKYQGMGCKVYMVT